MLKNCRGRYLLSKHHFNHSIVNSKRSPPIFVHAATNLNIHWLTFGGFQLMASFPLVCPISLSDARAFAKDVGACKSSAIKISFLFLWCELGASGSYLCYSPISCTRTNKVFKYSTSKISLAIAPCFDKREHFDSSIYSRRYKWKDWIGWTDVLTQFGY